MITVTWPGRWGPVGHLCFCQTSASVWRDGSQWSKWLLKGSHATICADRYHGVSVRLQFVGGDGLPVLEEEVLKEALKRRHQENKLKVAGKQFSRKALCKKTVSESLNPNVQCFSRSCFLPQCSDGAPQTQLFKETPSLVPGYRAPWQHLPAKLPSYKAVQRIKPHC